MAETVKVRSLRELDALVAEKVMGLADPPYYSNFYSTDIAAAWEVVENLRRQGLSVLLCDDPEPWSTTSPRTGWGFTVARGCVPIAGVESRETAPIAICLAALRAKEIEVEMELEDGDD